MDTEKPAILKLARFMRYALFQISHMESNGQDTSKWRRVLHLMILVLQGVLAGEIPADRLAGLFQLKLVKKYYNSAISLDNFPTSGKIKLGNPRSSQMDGGAGSGNFGHSGRPGKVGGSASGGSSGASGSASEEYKSSAPNAASSIQAVRKTLNERIANGTLSTKLDVKKQNKHIVGSKQYSQYIAQGRHPSTLDMPEKDRQKFVDKYIKDGEPQLRRDGSIRIQFEHSSNIGTWKSEDGSQTAETNCGSIHLSKTGAHIVPEEPKRN